MKKIWIPATVAGIAAAVVFISINVRKAQKSMPDLESEE